MVRPTANILASTNVTDYLTIDIQAAGSLYAVFYKDKPINIKQKYWTAKGMLTKYPKMTFTTPAPADNLAKKLNKQFHCSDFTAKKII